MILLGAFSLGLLQTRLACALSMGQQLLTVFDVCRPDNQGDCPLCPGHCDWRHVSGHCRVTHGVAAAVMSSRRSCIHFPGCLRIIVPRCIAVASRIAGFDAAVLCQVITKKSCFEVSMLLPFRNDAKSKTGQQSTTDKISDTVGQKVRTTVV